MVVPFHVDAYIKWLFFRPHEYSKPIIAIHVAVIHKMTTVAKNNET